MTKKPSELSSLQAGRALAALAVVLYHLNGSVFGNANYWPEPFNPIFASGFSGVEYFFVLSGFLMAHVHWDQIGQRNNPAHFIRKRFLRIYPAYWLTMAGALALLLATGNLKTPPLSILREMALLPTEGLPTLAVAWTLQHEMMFYLFFAAFLWRPAIGGVVMGAWILTGLVGPFFRPAFPLSFLTHHTHVLFGLGMSAAWAFRHGVKSPLAVTLCGAALFSVAWYFGAAGDQGVPHTQALSWSFGLGAALIIVGLAQLERDDRLRTPKALQFLGDASYSIYLVHFPAVTLIADKIFDFGLSAAIPKPFYFLAILLAAVTAGIGFHIFIEKPIIRLLQRRVRHQKF